MTLDLRDDEARALVQFFFRRAIDEEHYFPAPRLDPLKAMLAKLEPPQLQPEPLRRCDRMTLVGLCAGATCLSVAPQHWWGVPMREPIESGRGVVQKSFGRRGIVMSAWPAAIIFIVLFAGFQASHRDTIPHRTLRA